MYIKSIIFICALLSISCEFNLSPTNNNASKDGKPQSPVTGGGDEYHAQYKGYNIEGKLTSCKVIDSSQLVCTEIFTPEDQFALDCKANGFQTFMCGCHKFLCSGNISELSTPNIKSNSLKALLGTHFQYTKSGMLGDIYNYTVDLDRPQINGTVYVDGSAIDNDPYILEKQKGIEVVDKSLWNHLDNALTQTLYVKLSDPDCADRVMIAQEVFSSVKNLKTNKIYNDTSQQDPLLCHEFNDRMPYFKAALWALFIKSGAQPASSIKTPRICDRMVYRLTHPEFSIQITADNGCQKTDLEKMGFKLKD